MDRCTIRPYAPADREAVNAVALAAFSQYSGDYQDWPGFAEGIARMADLAEVGELLVASSGGGITGAVVHMPPGSPRKPMFPEAWSLVRMLVVAPDRRGAGIGRQLMAGCLRAAERAGAPVLGLHTSPIMAPALRMYLALGFERDADLPPERGVPYGRYVLPASAFREALARLEAC